MDPNYDLNDVKSLYSGWFISLSIMFLGPFLERHEKLSYVDNVYINDSLFVGFES